MGVDQRIGALARGQHGVVSAAQLIAAGLTHDAIRHRVKRGWLRRVHRGVYLVGPLETAHSRAMAAVLAYGDGALLGHEAAVVLRGFRPPPARAMHVIVPGRDVRGRDGIQAHTVSDFDPRDATRLHGIPVTSAERTLLDYAATATTNELDRAANEARVLRAVTEHSLNEQFRRYPTHRGTAALREAIRTEPKLTRSEAETTLLALVRQAGLPEPETNARIAGYEVDFLWRDRRLIVEVDGYAFHSMRSAFERDRRKDAQLTARGWRVIRVTWRQLKEDAIAVVATLATAIAA